MKPTRLSVCIAPSNFSEFIKNARKVLFQDLVRAQSNSYPQGVSRYYISIYNIICVRQHEAPPFSARGGICYDVVIENKAGAGGTIAMTELACLESDGYTIEAFFTNASKP